jgi:hypothetical protein
MEFGLAGSLHSQRIKGQRHYVGELLARRWSRSRDWSVSTLAAGLAMQCAPSAAAALADVQGYGIAEGHWLE